MCGIVGYIGPQSPEDFLLRGLQLLEYCGYDSAGIAIVDTNSGIQIVRTPGRLQHPASIVRVPHGCSSWLRC